MVSFVVVVRSPLGHVWFTFGHVFESASGYFGIVAATYTTCTCKALLVKAKISEDMLTFAVYSAKLSSNNRKMHVAKVMHLKNQNVQGIALWCAILRSGRKDGFRNRF